MSHNTVYAGMYLRENVVPGNSFERQYICVNSSDIAVDITGYDVRWKGVYGDHTIFKSLANGTLQVPDPTNGAINFYLSPEETRLVPVNDAMRYELELSAFPTQITVLSGDLVGHGGYNVD